MFILFLLSFSFAQPLCQEGTFWDQNYEGGSCRTCPTNCRTCLSLDKCTSCDISNQDEMQKFYLNSNFQCVQRDQTNMNCKTWDGLNCIDCQEGFYLYDGKCNNPCGITNCEKCNMKKCFKCISGYTLHEDNGKQECIDCNLSINDEKCGRCSSRKYFNMTTLKCENCRANCARCSTSDNCYFCSPDYVLETPSDPKSRCVKIPSCKNGYYSGNQCMMCEEGFFVYEGKCKACSTNCARCIDLNTCVECYQGSTLSENKCVKDDNCIRSNNIQRCIECREGWYLGDNGKCQKCGEQCEKCLKKDNCLRCAENYFFENVEQGKCKKMDTQTCTVTNQYGCLQCKNNVVVSSFNSSQSHITQEIINKASEGITWNVTDDKRYFGFYLELNYNNATKTKTYNKECSLCDPRCRICEHKSTWCAACNDGYELKYDQNATAEYFAIFGENRAIYNCGPKSENCVKTEMGYCVECRSGYFLHGMDCVKCHESCGTCINDRTCETCKDENVIINGIEHKKYWRPPIFENLSGVEKGACFRVEETFYENNFDKCKVPITTSGCSECVDNYKAINGKCVNENL